MKLSTVFLLATILPLGVMMYVVFFNVQLFSYGESGRVGNSVFFANLLLSLVPSLFLLPLLVFFLFGFYVCRVPL
jgi:hypothetical protein